MGMGYYLLTRKSARSSGPKGSSWAKTAAKWNDCNWNSSKMIWLCFRWNPTMKTNKLDWVGMLSLGFYRPSVLLICLGLLPPPSFDLRQSQAALFLVWPQMEAKQIYFTCKLPACGRTTSKEGPKNPVECPIFAFSKGLEFQELNQLALEMVDFKSAPTTCSWPTFQLGFPNSADCSPD